MSWEWNLAHQQPQQQVGSPSTANPFSVNPPRTSNYHLGTNNQVTSLGQPSSSQSSDPPSITFSFGSLIPPNSFVQTTSSQEMSTSNPASFGQTLPFMSNNSTYLSSNNPTFHSSSANATSNPSSFNNAIGIRQPGTKAIPYQASTKQDGSGFIIVDAITCMRVYEDRSFEELRWEDYCAGNKGTGSSLAQANKENTSPPRENSSQQQTLSRLETLENDLESALKKVREMKDEVKKKERIEEEERMCVICHSQKKCVLMIPCRHMCVCVECSAHSSLNMCPLCRKAVTNKLCVFW